MGATLKAANEFRRGASFHGEDTRSGNRLAESGVHRVARPVGILRDGSRSNIVGAALLSAVAGYVDAAGFLALFGLFTAHVTGDLVAAGAVIAERVTIGMGIRLLMIPVFMLSVAGASLFARSTRRRGRNPLRPLLALMTLALAAFCTTGVMLRSMAREPDAWGVALIGGTAVIAMAIQNTLMRDALSGLSPTTIMTGNLTQCTIDLVEIFLPLREGDREQRRRVRTAASDSLVRYGVPLVGFMFGALLGAWLTAVYGLFSIALPTIVVGIFTLSLKAQSRRFP
jgi:uncharacterized membrane protein YoaK (UPF0700 family)